MTKAYIALKDGFTCLMDCDSLTRDDERGYLHCWCGDDLQGVFCLDDIRCAYITRPKKVCGGTPEKLYGSDSY